MANQTIYPFGPAGQTPITIPIADDLVTERADTALSAKQGTVLRDVIGDGFFQEVTLIDLNVLTEQLCSLGSPGKWYTSGTAGRHKAIPLTQGKTYRLKCLATGDGHGFWGLVTSSYSPPYANNDTVPYISTQSARNQIEAQERVVFTPPADAAYLIICTVDGGDYSPGWEVTELEAGSTDRGTVEEELDRIEGMTDGKDPKRDASYTSLSYDSEPIRIRMANTAGIKAWSAMLSGQGMAIFGNLVVRMRADSVSSIHYIYTIGSDGTLTKVAEFSCSTAGHANALQFASVVESGQAYPYLYVSDITTKCTVLSIDASYNVTQVQTITAPSGTPSLQMLIGDDGYLWGWWRESSGALTVVKYRRVLVSEGASVTLTSNDEIERWTTYETYPSASYVMQGFKFKFGKFWLIVGTSGSSQKRALAAYDTATHGRCHFIDLTAYANVEYEDLDFWDNAIILATWANTTNSNSYIMRF